MKGKSGMKNPVKFKTQEEFEEHRDLLRYVRDDAESVAAGMRCILAGKHACSPAVAAELRAAMRAPEVAGAVREFVEDHFDEVVDEIPKLDLTLFHESVMYAFTEARA
jgi:hypothetical protein